MKTFALLLLSAGLSFAQCITDSRGVCLTGLTAIQDNLLGPLIPNLASPWIYGDKMEKAVIDNMAPEALLEAPALGAALSGTFSWTSGSQTLATTVDQTGAGLAQYSFIALAWTTVDGAGTGRGICQINTVTTTTVTCTSGVFAPTSSGVTGYKMSTTAGTSGFDFRGWAPQSPPSTTWNYYDNGIALYRFHYRIGSGDTTYLSDARQYADIQWQWTLDHGYSYVVPRAASMVSQFFRALDGHSERLPYLYAWINYQQGSWGNPTGCPSCDNREQGYMLWDIALGAKVDTDPTRHAQYCSWLSTFTTTWNSKQQSDGSWGENEYGLNPSYVSAPKTFSAPFIYEGAPWREAINVKAMEAAYESLNDTSTQGCNSPSLAASTLTSVTNAVTWQYTYGRSTTNRGAFYEVNSQSNDQQTTYPGTGTVAATLTSTALVGTGTNWVTAGFCDGTHFIGIQNGSPRGVYKIASCADDTHATLSVAFGLYSESASVSGSPIAFSPAASTSCGGSLATYCYTGVGDRNLTRTMCGGMGWLYAQTFNSTYKSWTSECVSATLGGPTAGPTSADNEGSFTLPCSGSACDGYVGDTGEMMKNCNSTGNVPPCMFGNSPYGNLGKNFGEAFGAPGIDNALAWLLYGTAGASMPGNAVVSGKAAVD